MAKNLKDFNQILVYGFGTTWVNAGFLSETI